jgi:hypothetical protein
MEIVTLKLVSEQERAIQTSHLKRIFFITQGFRCGKITAKYTIVNCFKGLLSSSGFRKPIDWLFI